MTEWVNISTAYNSNNSSTNITTTTYAYTREKNEWYIYTYDRTAKVYAFVKKVVKNVQNIENTYFLSEAYFRFISISGI